VQQSVIRDYPIDVLDTIRRSRWMTQNLLENLVLAPGDDPNLESNEVLRRFGQAIPRASPPVRRYGRWFLHEAARRLRAGKRRLGLCYPALRKRTCWK
jgi:hypothetical protein